MMKTRNEKNFTLIELLVVIGIIALLAALMFPAIGSVRAHAKKVQAQAIINALKTAITQYEAQYGLLPVDYTNILTTNSKDDVVYYHTTTGPDSENLYLGTADYDKLIDNLSCVDVDGNAYKNARSTRFLTGLPVTGSNANEKTLTDPYKISGQKYGVRLAIAMDVNGDGQVIVNGTPYNGKIFIWSYGPDNTNQWGVSKSTGDDIPSWE